MYDYQGMVILAANQVWWTWEVEDVFLKVKRGDKMGMKNYSKKLHGQIDDLVVQVRVHAQRPRCLLEHPLILLLCLCTTVTDKNARVYLGLQSKGRDACQVVTTVVVCNVACRYGLSCQRMTGRSSTQS